MKISVWQQQPLFPVKFIWTMQSTLQCTVVQWWSLFSCTDQYCSSNPWILLNCLTFCSHFYHSSPWSNQDLWQNETEIRWRLRSLYVFCRTRTSMEIPVLSYLLEPGFEPWQVSVEPEHLRFPPHLHFKASPATTPPTPRWIKIRCSF